MTKKLNGFISLVLSIVLLFGMFGAEGLVTNASAYDKEAFIAYLKEQFENYAEEIDIRSFNISRSGNSTQSLYDLIDEEIPGMFNVESYALWFSSSSYVKITAEYQYSQSEYSALLTQFYNNTEYLLKDLRESSLPDSDKALIVHDRLVAWSEYDYDNLISGTVPPDSKIAFGAIVRRKAVCEGYSKAFQYLVRQLGIECECVSSSALNHKWNIITINGKRYHLDATYDDPIPPDLPGYVGHLNVLRSTAGIKSSNHNANDFDSSPTDTTFDNSYWQNSCASFQYYGDALYYINYNNGKLIKRVGNTETTVNQLETMWFTPSGSYYGNCHSKLCRDNDYLYYNSQDKIYSVDAAGNVNLVYSPEIPSGYVIYGFDVNDGYFYIYCYKYNPYDKNNPSDCHKIVYRYLTCTLTYDANGGSGAPANQTGYGNITLSSTKPTKSGYTFLGWADSADATSAQYSAGGTYNLTANKTIYAVWKKATVTKITVKTLPSKTSYYTGQTLDTAGLTLTATYDNGSTKTVSSGFTCSPTTLNTAGTQTVTVTYSGKTTTFTVTVTQDSIKSIAVKSKPTKTSYYTGQTLNTAGLTLTATYNSGKTETVSSGFTCSPTTLNTAGTQTITVTYSGKTTTFTVTVTQDAIKSIAVKSKPTKTSYYTGQTLNTAGLTLTATYNSGKTETVSSGFTCSPTTLNTAGTQTITVTYSGKTATFTVTVTQDAIKSIAVKSKPTKTSYYTGQTLNTAGLTLTATYNSGKTEIVSSGFTCSPTTLNTAGTQTITVTYSGKTATFTVTVTQDAVKSIAVKSKPTKTSYYTGQTLDTSGLTLTATYNSGKTATVSSGFTCSPTTLNTAGTQTITVTHSGKTATFTVTVTQDSIKSIAVKSKPAKTSYYTGQALDTTGLTLTATYNSGKTETVSSGFTCSPTTLNTAGTQTITVTYSGKTATFTVTVLNPYTLTYSASGADNVPSPQTGYGSITLSSAKPAKSGYAFLGWADSANATSAQYSAGGTYNLTANKTIYAVWQQLYTLSFDANSGQRAPANMLGNGEITLPSVVPVRSGYVFDGWSLSGAALYRPGSSFNLTTDTTLTAIWSVNSQPAVQGPETKLVPATSNIIIERDGVAETRNQEVCNGIHELPNGAQPATVCEEAGELYDYNTYAEDSPEYDSWFIYGIEPYTTPEQLEAMISIGDGGYCVISNVTGRYVGTGTIVKIFDKNNSFVEQFRVVIYGDLDNSGSVTSSDTNIAIQESKRPSWSKASDADRVPYMYRAANVDQSTSFSSSDANLLIMCNKNKAIIDPVSGKAGSK